jgi:two-component system, NtrC family, sensor kinase
MRVLVADDVELIRLLHDAVLREMGHEPALAADGEEAWAMFQREPFPLVLLDWQMPRLDGLELTRRIRAAPNGDRAFVLVVTARDAADDLNSVLDAGADDYLSKPVTPEQLRARLTIAERRMAADEARHRAEEALARAQWLAGIGQTSLALQHEINNPLAALLAHAELLRDAPGIHGPEKDQLEVITRQARRIADVVARLRQLQAPKAVEYVKGSKMLDLGEGKLGAGDAGRD